MPTRGSVTFPTPNLQERLAQLAGPLCSLVKGTIPAVKEAKLTYELIRAMQAANSPALRDLEELCINLPSWSEYDLGQLDHLASFYGVDHPGPICTRAMAT